MTVRLAALRTGRPYHQEYPWYSFSLEAAVDTRVIALLGLEKLKNPKITSGIRHAIVRLVA
jgi:hypothetical protein